MLAVTAAVHAVVTMTMAVTGFGSSFFSFLQAMAAALVLAVAAARRSLAEITVAIHVLLLIATVAVAAIPADAEVTSKKADDPPFFLLKENKIRYIIILAVFASFAKLHFEKNFYYDVGYLILRT